MLYNVYFEVCAAIFLVLFYMFLRTQYTSDNLGNLEFRQLAIATFFADVLDVITAITISYSERVPVFLNYILNSGYFLVAAISGYMMARYTRSYLMHRRSALVRISDFFDKLFIILYSIACIITPFTGLIFRFDENGAYQHGPLYYMLYVVFTYYVLVCGIMLMVEKTAFTKKQALSVFFFILMIGGAVALQLFFFPNVLLNYFGATLALFCMMFALETPDYKALMDALEAVGNMKAEADEARKLAETERENAEEAKVVAQQADQAKSSFLANTSHEIRSPLNVILGFNQMIKKSNSLEEISEYSDRIQESGEMLVGIINDILDFSKIESGGLDLFPVEYEIHEIIREVASGNEMTAKAKGIDFRLHVADNLPEVLYGDIIRVRQIFMNLLSNAVKYTDEGTIDFTVRCGPPQPDPRNMILDIVVADTGRGISEEGKKQLFQSFKRLDESKNRAIQGTGLGLAITKSLIDKMEGVVTVDSEEGKGTTFRVLIPQVVCSKQKKSKDIQKEEVFIAPEAMILAVDDMALNLRVLKGMLAETQIKLDTVDNGLAALAMAHEKRYDLILLDHMMPEMDGVETFRQLKTTRNLNQETPVIMLTANAIAGMEEAYKEEGFSDYMSKPIKGDKLKQLIRKWLPPEKIQIVEEPDEEEA